MSEEITRKDQFWGENLEYGHVLLEITRNIATLLLCIASRNTDASCPIVHKWEALKPNFVSPHFSCAHVYVSPSIFRTQSRHHHRIAASFLLQATNNTYTELEIPNSPSPRCLSHKEYISDPYFKGLLLLGNTSLTRQYLVTFYIGRVQQPP